MDYRVTLIGERRGGRNLTSIKVVVQIGRAHV